MATVKKFGTQQLFNITFAPTVGNKVLTQSNIRHTVKATANHRWPLTNGTLTNQLVVGDTVDSVFVESEDSSEYENGFRHGLVFGDGSRVSESKFQVRLCGDKRQFAYLFPHVIYPPSYNGDAMAYTWSEQELKTTPTLENTYSYVRGFVDGWVAADGTDARGQTEISSQNHEAVQWLADNAARAGYLVSGISEQEGMRTNFGNRKSTLKKIRITQDALRGWRVVSVEPLGEEPVYCAVVPEVERFALANGVYTANCAAVSVQDNLSHPAHWTTDLLMNGVGVGFDTHRGVFGLTEPTETEITYQIPDSREGWADSISLLVESYEIDYHPTVRFDYSLLRPAGAPIKSFGGTASGPEPLRQAHEQIRTQLSKAARGEIGRSQVITDVMNIIGTAVVAGNTRRSAEIALGSPQDRTFIEMKDYTKYPERGAWGWLSNNSIMIESKEDIKYLPDIAENIRLNGEPGVLNLLNIQQYGRIGEESPDAATLANPCSEIPLESWETCNLSEVFPTRCKTQAEFFEALELATLYSSTIALLPTHREETNSVIERNRRIGVSISGIAGWFDTTPTVEFIEMLRKGYRHVVKINQLLAVEAGVPPSVRVTTVKPSGSISLLAGVSPGMHYPVFSTYIRRIRVGKIAPVAQYLMDAGIPYEPDVNDENTLVFSVPVKEKARRGQRDISIWQKAALLKVLQKNWADNMVSNTITFDPEREGHEIGDVLAHFIQDIKSTSFLPDKEEGAYAQMPYEKITNATYAEMRKGISPIDWTQFSGSDGQDSKFCSNSECEL